MQVGQFRDTETGIEKEAQQLKKINPKMKVIFYWNTFLDYSMYEAHAEYRKASGVVVEETRMGTLDLKKGRMKRYDLSNPEVRDWWTSVASEAVVNGSADGVFMDAFPQVTSKANRKSLGRREIRRDSARVEGHYQGNKRRKIGDDKLIVYNGIRSTPTWNAGFDFPEHTDAAMIEHFGHFQSSSKGMHAAGYPGDGGGRENVERSLC